MHKFDAGGSKKGRRWGLLRIVSVIGVAASLAVQAGISIAQQIPGAQFPGQQNLTPDQMRQMFGTQGLGQSDQTPQPQTTILEPTAPTGTAQPQSRLEQIMSARIGVKLQQFGYDQLGVGRSINLPQVGGVQDDYILGPGDEIVVTLRGQDNTEQRVTVGRDGSVVIPRISPVSAAGRRFGDFKQEFLAAIHSAYISTDAYITIGRLRQISVMVAGQITSPGVRIMTGLSTPLDAILVSGGVLKTGSLRNVEVIHRDRTYTVDLYAYLTSGISSPRITLADGDRIIVPTLRRVVAVSGWVRQPGIFELPPGQSEITVGALESLAGGPEVRGQYRVVISRIGADGRNTLVPVTGESNIVRDGEILIVTPGADQTVDQATLAGGTSLAGSYSINANTRLSDILKSPGALGATPYAVFGIISRRDPRTYLRSLIAFSPIGALSGASDPHLISGDIVRVFSMREGSMLAQSVAGFTAQKEQEEELSRNPFAANPAYSPSATAPGTTVGATVGATPGTTPTSPTTGTTPTSGLSNLSGFSPTTNGTAAQVAAAATAVNPGAATPATGQNSMPGAVNTNIAVPGGTSAALATGYLNAAKNAVSTELGAPPAPPNLEQQTSPLGPIALNTEVASVGDLAQQLAVDPIVLLNFLADHEVTLDGAVRGPGSYVVGPGINLHDLVMVAGGTLRWTDESGVELISNDVNQQTGEARLVRTTLPLNSATLASYTVKPHDEFRFRQVFTALGAGTVTLQGEVHFPGQYKIVRGEKLDDLLKRAGGLTDVAYPYGTVYLRRSIASLEEESFRRVADSIENQLLAAMSRSTASTQKLDPATFAAAQTFVDTLRNQRGLGRMSVTADPVVLAARPEQNPLLEPGDVIYIPQRPSTVSVLGEVLQPGTYPYQGHMSAREYLARAGGYNAFADSSLTYVILPDGSAEKLDRSWLPFDSAKLPPGSVIVVPRDIAPFAWGDFAINASQIFSQLAVAGASLAVISGR